MARSVSIASWTSGEPGSSAASTSRIGGQVLVLDLDRGDRGGGLLRGQRGDGRDDLALEADDVAGEQRPVEDEVERAVAALGDVVLGQDREDAGQGPGAGRVEADDPGVGSSGQQQPRVGQPGEREVRGVARLAGRLRLAVGADPRAGGRRAGRRDAGSSAGGLLGTSHRRGHGRLILRGAWSSAENTR